MGFFGNAYKMAVLQHLGPICQAVEIADFLCLNIPRHSGSGIDKRMDHACNGMHIRIGGVMVAEQKNRSRPEHPCKRVDKRFHPVLGNVMEPSETSDEV